MPKKGGKSGKKSLGSGPRDIVDQDRVVRIPFSFINESAVAAGVGSLSLVPSALGRANTVADTFSFYRISELRYRLHPTSTAQTASVAVAYYSGVVDTAPASMNVLTQNPFRCYLSPQSTVPSQWITLGWRELKSYFPWYKSNLGATTSAEEIQGTLYLVSPAATTSYVLEYEGIMEVRGPVATAQTPMLVPVPAPRDPKLEEKRRLLQLLSYSPPNSDTTGRVTRDAT